METLYYGLNWFEDRTCCNTTCTKIKICDTEMPFAQEVITINFNLHEEKYEGILFFCFF